MPFHASKRSTHCTRQFSAALALLALLTGPMPVQAQTADIDLESSYRFLVNDRQTGDGMLYTATAGKLQGKRLPLSFVDSPAYWGEHVCLWPGTTCGVIDRYDPQTSTLTPLPSPAGDLQTERINTHNGANIYDGAAWQIGVMLGRVRNRFSLPPNQEAYGLVSNQNQLLQAGYNGDSKHATPRENRAVTVGKVFVYNQQIINEPTQAYTFRMLPRNWLATDPLAGSKFAALITAKDLPANNADYQPGKVSWTDWKPITGENSWAFLLGPLQAAYLHYLVEQKAAFIPFGDLAMQNAVTIIPTFAAMQSPSGAVYYAPAGTIANQGDQPVDPYEVAVENNLSLYAGLTILRITLQTTLTHETTLSGADKASINQTLQRCEAMIQGGEIGANRRTAGLLSFFKNSAWRDGGFVQGGRMGDPTGANRWIPNLQPRAVDVNTWGIAALGAQQIDQWFGFGASYRNWQQVKQWGGYGVGKTLWGVGFSDQDGNGIDAEGNYRQGILSAEWTAGAINMVRELSRHYRSIPQTSAHYPAAQGYITTLAGEEQSMLKGLARLRIDTYTAADFPGQPQRYARLLSLQTRPYLYASKRYRIPFGWYANPLPSTCATAWVIMLANHYNPFAYGGNH